MAELLRLVLGPIEAELAPALGGRLTLLRHAGDDIVVPLPEDHADPLFWGKGGGYPLLPYHNRIENAQLRFGGTTHALTPYPEAAPHSLHGPAQRRPWRVLAQDRASAVLALDYAADADWPWAFEARQRFTLEENGMGLVLTLRNADSAPMPAGLGWHPNFPAGTVAHDARFHWPMRPDYLPTGERQAGPGTAAATLYLEDWSQARVKRDARETALTASPELTHLVVHDAGPYQCLEAATHLANGFNLAADGTAQTGMRVLAPGEMLQGRVDIRIRRLGSEAS